MARNSALELGAHFNGLIYANLIQLKFDSLMLFEFNGGGFISTNSGMHENDV